MHQGWQVAVAVLAVVGLLFFVYAIVKAKRQRKLDSQPTIEPAAEPEPFVVYRVTPMWDRKGYHRDKFECREGYLVYAMGKDDANPIGMLSNENSRLHLFGKHPA